MVEDRHTALRVAEGGVFIDTHRPVATSVPACTQQRCSGGRKPCPTPLLCRAPAIGLARPIPTNFIGRLLRWAGVL